MSKYSHRVVKWVKENRLEAIILVIILLAGSLMRLYRIDEYMTFLGDEGRDAIIVRRLLVNFDLILIGPGTSIGNMYLGPLYYYMMAPFLLLYNFSPVGPAIGVALAGIMTIWMVWYVGRVWFGRVPGLVSALLFAISPAVIIYSRSSWNPNIMPLFALLTVWSTWQFWVKKNYKWIVIAGVSLAVTLQSHYLALLLIPVVGLFWMIQLIRVLRNSKERREFVKYSVLSIISFVALMSPLVIFDARHGWRNFASLDKFFSERQTTVSAKPWNALPNLDHVLERISQALVHPTETSAPKVATVIFGFTLLWLTIKLFTSDKSARLQIDLKRIWKRFNSANLSPYILLVTWLGVGLIGLGVYKQEIYAHYFGFIFAGIFLLIGGFIGILHGFRSRLWIAGSALFVGFIAVAQLQSSPLRYPPNNQLARTAEVAEAMKDISGGKKFNFAVIAERNYEGAYQYFLEKDNVNFVIIDPLRIDETLADQLLVVCELPKDKCDPTHNPKAEVANFGWSEIESEHDVMGVAIYKLVHSK